MRIVMTACVIALTWAGGLAAQPSLRKVIHFDELSCAEWIINQYRGPGISFPDKPVSLNAIGLRTTPDSPPNVAWRACIESDPEPLTIDFGEPPGLVTVHVGNLDQPGIPRPTKRDDGREGTLLATDSVVFKGRAPFEIGDLPRLGFLDVRGSFGLSGELPLNSEVQQDDDDTAATVSDQRLGFDLRSGFLDIVNEGDFFISSDNRLINNFGAVTRNRNNGYFADQCEITNHTGAIIEKGKGESK